MNKHFSKGAVWTALFVVVLTFFLIGGGVFVAAEYGLLNSSSEIPSLNSILTDLRIINEELPPAPPENSESEEEQEVPLVGGSCGVQIEAAQEYAKDRICSAEVQTLICASDREIAYEARNGCEISFLKKQGWFSR